MEWQDIYNNIREQERTIEYLQNLVDKLSIENARLREIVNKQEEAK